MSKLLKLKEWLTVGEAAKRLSISAGEDVTEADILRLALDGHLILSVYFVNHAQGRPAKIEPLGEQHYSNAPSLFVLGPPPYMTLVAELFPNRKDVLVFEGDEQQPESVQGVWDLMMLGAESLDVEHAYQLLTGGPAVDLTCLGGPLVISPDQTKVFQILDSFKYPARTSGLGGAGISKDAREAMDRLNTMVGQTPATIQAEKELQRWDYEIVYHPAAGLPENSTLVVRTAALRDLEAKLLADEAQPEKQLHQSERSNVAKIISVLAAMAKVNLSSPYKAAEILKKAAAEQQFELPASDETIVKFLTLQSGNKR